MSDELREGRTDLEITDDPIVLRTILQAVIDVLRGPGGRATSRGRSLAINKLQEARFWLMEDEMNSPPSLLTPAVIPKDVDLTKPTSSANRPKGMA